MIHPLFLFRATDLKTRMDFPAKFTQILQGNPCEQFYAEQIVEKKKSKHTAEYIFVFTSLGEAERTLFWPLLGY